MCRCFTGCLDGVRRLKADVGLRRVGAGYIDGVIYWAADSFWIFSSLILQPNLISNVVYFYYIRISMTN